MLEARYKNKALREDADRRNELRKVFLDGLGRVLIFAGLLLGIVKYSQTELANQQQLKNATDARLAGEFNRAIEMLAATPEVSGQSKALRQARIFALGQISMLSERYYPFVTQFLHDFIAERAEETQSQLCQTNPYEQFLEIRAVEKKSDNQAEIEAAIQVLGIVEREKYEQRSLDLRKLSLSQYDLKNLYLPYSLFDEADLSATDFYNTTFITTLEEDDTAGTLFRSRTSFRRANLTQTNFGEAKLRHSEWEAACLRETHFLGADLSYAEFIRSKLAGTYFQKAILHEANFYEAQFTGVVHFESAQLINAKFINAQLAMPSQMGEGSPEPVIHGVVIFHGADLQGAEFSGAVLEGSLDFSEALNLKWNQFEDIRGKLKAGFKPPSYLMPPPQWVRDKMTAKLKSELGL